MAGIGVIVGNTAGKQAVAVDRTITDPPSHSNKREQNRSLALSVRPTAKLEENLATTTTQKRTETSAKSRPVATVMRRTPVGFGTGESIGNMSASSPVQVEVPTDGVEGSRSVGASRKDVGQGCIVGIHRRRHPGVTEMQRGHANHIVPSQGSTFFVVGKGMSSRRHTIQWKTGIFDFEFIGHSHQMKRRLG